MPGDWARDDDFARWGRTGSTCTHPNCEAHGKSPCVGVGCDGLDAVERRDRTAPTSAGVPASGVDGFTGPCGSCGSPGVCRADCAARSTFVRLLPLPPLAALDSRSTSQGADDSEARVDAARVLGHPFTGAAIPARPTSQGSGSMPRQSLVAWATSGGADAPASPELVASRPSAPSPSSSSDVRGALRDVDGHASRFTHGTPGAVLECRTCGARDVVDNFGHVVLRHDAGCRASLADVQYVKADVQHSQITTSPPRPGARFECSECGGSAVLDGAGRGLVPHRAGCSLDLGNVQARTVDLAWTAGPVGDAGNEDASGVEHPLLELGQEDLVEVLEDLRGSAGYSDTGRHTAHVLGFLAALAVPGVHTVRITTGQDRHQS